MTIHPPPLPAAKLPGGGLLNLEEIARFQNLLLFAQAVVEGFFAGRHPSPYYGSNVEFADYKGYAPGDDVSAVDWRLYGRTRRLFVRKYREETDMAVYLLIDTSGSMRYHGRGREPKYRLAGRLAAALAWLITHQGDKVSLTLFAESVRQFFPPRGTRRHLHEVIGALEGILPAARTNLTHAVQQCVTLFKKRGRILLLSDFLGCDRAGLFDALGQFRHRGYEVLLMQIIDPDELNLPDVGVARFVDAETLEQVQVEPAEIRRDYQANMDALIADLGAQANRRRMTHALIDSRHPYLDALEAYVGFQRK